ncbi:hypothetical protein PGT21_012160 [Puccinia graminis f. sp. tritici]|uniref:Uncharacterized protein n=1 Tax=Puccinia graminis f. sp. tritici TaxID=56615 RepID=A0A5B0N279_PUCGR|nr:hypothetical protein PGTUg99_029237 [Puccinia graminis f. sp. tritici]KAA1094173.1 hypothetical protein PGT21_012160 [Puccinia graminis f. sp. tritici]
MSDENFSHLRARGSRAYFHVEDETLMIKSRTGDSDPVGAGADQGMRFLLCPSMDQNRSPPDLTKHIPHGYPLPV